MTHSSRVRMTGPLVPHLDTIWLALLGSGYAADSARNLLRVAAHLSRWLEQQRLVLEDLTAGRIEAFLEYRRSQGYTGWLGPRCLEPILEPIRAHGVVPGPGAPEESSPLGSLFRDFETHLLEDRGLGAATVAARLRVARRFFTALAVDTPTTVRRLSTADISSFVLQEARSLGVGSMTLVATHLRSLLRFLHLRDLCGELTAAVPAVAGHRQARLPKHIPWEDVARLIESCDRQAPSGRRDCAIVLVLARLALRAGEVAAIELGDIHWAGGAILIRGKGSRHGWLPLPEEVGAAVARYLAVGRPPSTSRRLFLKRVAPHGEITSGTVRGVVARACQRAGLPRRSAHQLRHTAATRMLRRGASLQDVAEALRHQSVDTTAIYAKVDHEALRPLARPWPGGGA